MKLDIGCGRNKKAGFVGVDHTQYPNVDVVHDLNKLPWPFPNSSVEHIDMRNCLEHLDNTLGVMNEIYRILKPNGTIYLEMPHFSSHDTYIDITHKRTFSLFSFNYFLPENEATFPKEVKFEIESRSIRFWAIGPKDLVKPAHFFGIPYIARRHPHFYERFLTYIFAARDIRFLLKAIKS